MEINQNLLFVIYLCDDQGKFELLYNSKLDLKRRLNELYEIYEGLLRGEL